MNLVKKFMASSERVWVATFWLCLFVLIVNVMSLLSQEKTRSYIDYLEQRIASVENIAIELQTRQQEQSKK